MRDALEDAVDLMQRKGAGYADARFEDVSTSRIEVKDRKVEDLSEGESRGVGMRAFYNGAWGFASTNDIGGIEEAAKRAVKSAKALHRDAEVEEYELQPRRAVEEKVEPRAKMMPGVMETGQRLALLEDAERTMRLTDKVKAARVVYSDLEGRCMFVNSDESFIEKNPTHHAIYCYATARSGDSVETHLERAASIQGLGNFSETDPINLGERAAEQAVKIVEAPRPPTGKMPVVLGERLGGLFAHEAVGHAAEADTVLSGDSILEGRRGDRVASEEVTIVDDPTLDGKHGSFTFDDEGVKGRETRIIEDGELENFLHSRSTSSRMGVEPTGNARAQSFSHRPLARMSNTFFDTGSASKEEIFDNIEEGLYLKGFKNGQVSTAEGNFTFGTTHAYVIENGEKKELVRGPSISGRTLQVLQNISMVADDREIGDAGYCGKGGQTVYVDTGSPHMKIDGLVVG